MRFTLFREDPPIEEEDRHWVHRRMKFLADRFGMSQLRLRRSVEPTAEFFPDPYDGTEAAARNLLVRVCPVMEVPAAQVDLKFYNDHRDCPEHSLELLDNRESERPAPNTRRCVSIRTDLAAEAGVVVALIAHQLSRLRIVTAKLLTSEEGDFGPLTDLATVYFGMGIFTASTCVRFSQWTHVQWSGWEASRLGFLDEQTYGYALALWSLIRGEDRPGWANHLAVNPKSYMKQSIRFLRRHPPAEFTL